MTSSFLPLPIGLRSGCDWAAIGAPIRLAPGVFLPILVNGEAPSPCQVTHQSSCNPQGELSSRQRPLTFSNDTCWHRKTGRLVLIPSAGDTRSFCSVTGETWT